MFFAPEEERQCSFERANGFPDFYDVIKMFYSYAASVHRSQRFKLDKAVVHIDKNKFSHDYHNWVDYM